MLDDPECSHGNIEQNQCICFDGYFDEHCGTPATRLALNEFSPSIKLSKGEVYFYIVLSSNKTLGIINFRRRGSRPYIEFSVFTKHSSS